MDELPDVPEMIRQNGIVTPYSLETGHSDKILPVNRRSIISNNELPGILELSRKDSLNKFNIAQIPADPETVKDNRDIMDGFWHISPHYTSGFEAFIPIQNGCDKFCTFCAVPYTRGREVSRPSDEILQELESLVNRGYKSITLLGQNVNSYGLDKKGSEISFPGLLDKIGRFGEKSGKEFRVYFTSPHPRDMTTDVIDTIAKYTCLAKQIHLPLQSGDDEVLKRMNRKHDLERYRKIVRYIRNKIPEATLFTDIIVGFTGETEDQFMNSRKALQEFMYNMAYIAIYSPRPGAVSSKWQDTVPHAIKKERLHVLTSDLEKTSRYHTNAMLGKTYRILVTGRGRKNKYMTGLTEGRINVRFLSDDFSLIGKFTDLKITGATDFSVEGELVNVLETNQYE
jgi:tRNA-2-methylthio-N6-dimethylallyladenosine synthase